MSNNVKFLNQQDAMTNKNHPQKKLSLNSKNLPGYASRQNKSFRGKIEKTQNNTKQPLGVINENDASQTNQANPKQNNVKQKLSKMKSMDKANNDTHTRNLSNTNAETKSKNSKNENKNISKKAYSLNLENLLTNINLKSKNKIETDEYRSMFSKYVRDDYSNSIISSLLEDEQINEHYLNSHKITERMRTRMVDWMIEVLSNYHCDESTYFESINLMDRYFKECDTKHQVLMPAELHLIGVTSMFIASKYQDIYPLRLKIVQDKIAHNKLSCEEIKNKEDEMMR